MQRKLREQGRKVKRAEEELGILKRTKMEVDDMEALWKGILGNMAQIIWYHLSSIRLATVYANIYFVDAQRVCK